MDNLAAHKAERVRHALEAAGIAYRYLPSYSPDLNPIEACWSKLKACLRTEAAPRSGTRWSRPRPGARHDHRSGRPRLVPPRRLPRSRLT